MPLSTRNNKLLIKSASKLATGCPSCDNTPESAMDFIVAQGYSAQVVVGSDDYNDECPSGDCTVVEGTYSLPYDSNTLFSPSSANVKWLDTFSVSVCGGSNVSYECQVQLDITVGAGSTLCFAWTVQFRSISSFDIDLRWTSSGDCGDCLDLAAASYTPSQLTTGTNRLCRTDSGVSPFGTVDLDLV